MDGHPRASIPQSSRGSDSTHITSNPAFLKAMSAVTRELSVECAPAGRWNTILRRDLHDAGHARAAVAAVHRAKVWKEAVSVQGNGRRCAGRGLRDRVAAGAPRRGAERVGGEASAEGYGGASCNRQALWAVRQAGAT